MIKDDKIYLLHVLECIRRVEEYTADGREGFLSSHLLQDGTLHNLQTMSESTQRLSEDLKTKHPEVDWAAIARFRNVVVHQYLGIDLEQVWKIVQDDVGKLKGTVLAMLEELGSEGDGTEMEADVPGSGAPSDGS